VPDDEVSFPIAHTAFAVHNGRALVNADAVGQLPPPVITAVAFAPLFAAAQRPMQRATLPLVRVDVLVDVFVADGGLPLQLEASGDLFGTPFLPQ